MNLTENQITDVFRVVSKNDLLARTAGELAKKDPEFAGRIAKKLQDALDEIEKALAAKAEETDGEIPTPTDQEIYDLIDNTDVEVDADAKISRGDDNGAYVQCWLWVGFEGTKFDIYKEA